jgi:hypothetical protein
MDDQAAVRMQNGSRQNGVLGSLTEFGNDLATLAELQLKLAELDARAAAERAVVPLAAAAGALAVLLAALPVLMLGVAALLASLLHVAEGWAMLLVGGVALVGAAITVAVAVPRLVRSFDSFRRSRDELTRNVSWMRTVLLYSGRPAPKHR